MGYTVNVKQTQFPLEVMGGDYRKVKVEERNQHG